MKLLEFTSVSKTYGGLRPLRLKQLAVEEGAIVALAGFDATTAEVFVNLATGATLPEEGSVSVLGRRTADITDSDDWLATVDRFGIISERVVLLERFTPLQNIAMALTLDVEPIPADVRERAAALAAEAGLSGEEADRALADGRVALRHRVRLARALAASPSVLLVEHPLAGLDRDEAGRLAADLHRVSGARRIAIVVLAADPSTATPFAERVLQLNGATGELADAASPGMLGRLMGWRRKP